MSGIILYISYCNAFELWCWRRVLTVPWIPRRSNQYILKEVNPEHSLEGLMLKLKLLYFGHLMWRADSFEKTLMLGKIEGKSRRGRQRMRWLDGITDSITVWVNSGNWWWTGKPGVLQFMGLQRVGHDWATELKCFLGNRLKCDMFITLSPQLSRRVTTATAAILSLGLTTCHLTSVLEVYGCNSLQFIGNSVAPL